VVPLNTTKYLAPQVNDIVLGIVVARNAEFYTLDINSEAHAILPALEFMGATRRDKPNY
jgi:exosome complex RNA-binding protein Rrp4